MAPIHVKLEGHLTPERLAGAVAPVAEQLAANKLPCGIVFDCQEMTGYEFSARSTFVDWNKRNRSVISRVAIVTDRALWRMVISAMALASRQNMKAFATLSSASEWAAGGDAG